MITLCCIVMQISQIALSADLGGGLELVDIPDNASVRVVEMGGDFSVCEIETPLACIQSYVGRAPLVMVRDGSARLIWRYRVPLFVTRYDDEQIVEVNVVRVFAVKMFDDPLDTEMLYFYLSLTASAPNDISCKLEQLMISIALNVEFRPAHSESCETTRK